MLVALPGPNINNVIVAIGVLGWEGLARLLRAQVLSLLEQAFVEAVRCNGTPHPQIILGHILPNLQPYIPVAVTLGVAGTILTESALSFLGLGVQIPRPAGVVFSIRPSPSLYSPSLPGCGWHRASPSR